MESMVERFVRYTSINTRSNEESTTIPSTQTQVDFAMNVLVPDLKAIGLDEVIYNRENGFVIGTLNANTDEKAPAIATVSCNLFSHHFIFGSLVSVKVYYRLIVIVVMK